MPRVIVRPDTFAAWKGSSLLVVGTDGRARLPYPYQYCEDFPDPRVLTAAARLSRSAAATSRA